MLLEAEVKRLTAELEKIPKVTAATGLIDHSHTTTHSTVKKNYDIDDSYRQDV